MSTMLPAARVRELLEIGEDVREIVEADGDPAARVAEGLTRLVGGDAGGVVFFVPRTSGGRPGITRLVPFGFSEPEAREAERLYVEQQRMGIDPAASKITLAVSPGVVTVGRRCDLVEDEVWYRSDFVNTYRRRWGLDDSIYGNYVAPDARVVGFACFRRWDRVAFSEEERVLAQLCFEGCALSIMRTHDPPLSRRQRETLRFLLEGQSAKAIAAEMDLSVHTVNEYIQAVYRALGVRSRGELMARKLRGHRLSG